MIEIEGLPPIQSFRLEFRYWSGLERPTLCLINRPTFKKRCERAMSVQSRPSHLDTSEDGPSDSSMSWCLPPETFQSIVPKVDGILRLVRQGLEEREPEHEEGSKTGQASGATENGAESTTEGWTARETAEQERDRRRRERAARADEAWKRSQRLTERVGKEVSREAPYIDRSPPAL